MGEHFPYENTGVFVSTPAMSAPNPCPVAFATRVIGGKWKPRIVWALIRTERVRFSELRRACPPISDRILSRELKELEAAGLILREQRLQLPPHTEYSLTALGLTLRPMMAAMAEWALSNRSALDTSPR